MFLTGFDSPRLNTLYVDKNLKFHGLIQAFSRTNRILNDKKSQGNIVCFRNLKEATDEAIALFSNKDAKETVLLESYASYISQFNEATERLLTLTPNIKPQENVLTAFEQYWHTHQQQALAALCQEENLNPAALEKLLHTYSFANRLPRDQEIIDALNQKPRILERKGALARIGERITQFIETFVDGMGGSV